MCFVVWDHVKDQILDSFKRVDIRFFWNKLLFRDLKIGFDQIIYPRLQIFEMSFAMNCFFDGWIINLQPLNVNDLIFELSWPNIDIFLLI